MWVTATLGVVGAAAKTWPHAKRLWKAKKLLDKLVDCIEFMNDPEVKQKIKEHFGSDNKDLNELVQERHSKSKTPGSTTPPEAR